MLLSQNDGLPLNYTVETTLKGAGWTLAATVALSDFVLRFIRFDIGPLNLKQLRITVTAAMGAYTRIAELAPIYVVAANSTSDNSSLPASTPSSYTASKMITTQPSSCTTTTMMLNALGIVAGFFGGVAGILLAPSGYFLWLLRKRSISTMDTAKAERDVIAILNININIMV